MPQRKLVLVLEDAREKIESWRWHYNGERPHSALGNLAPETFALVATAGLILRALVISVVLEANTYYVRDQLIEEFWGSKPHRVPCDNGPHLTRFSESLTSTRKSSDR